MDGTLKAIETTGTVDDQRQLHLDEPLPVSVPGRVRVIVLIPEASETEEREWLQAAATNAAFDFLEDDVENVYTLADGRPLGDQG